MSRSLTPIAVVTVALTLAGCDDAGSKGTTADGTVSAKKVSKEFGEATDAAKSFVAGEVSAYRAAMLDRLEAVDRRIATLRSRADELAGDARSELDRVLEDLQTRRDALRKDLGELQVSGEKAWQEMKTGLEQAWTELDAAVDDAVAQFDQGSDTGA